MPAEMRIRLWGKNFSTVDFERCPARVFWMVSCIAPHFDDVAASDELFGCHRAN